MEMSIRIAHLYPALLNIYADRGNIICLTRRCQWRGIGITVDEFGLGEAPAWQDYDLFYLGGGQDREQQLVCGDLQAKGAGLIEAVESGAVLLAVCGGYQLLGRHYRTGAGRLMEGIGLFGAYTEAGERRMIGNVVVESALASRRMLLAGFENHSGKTYLEKGQQALGRVVSGFGNNAEDGLEGAVLKNAIGTYLHGPLLPKNALLTDLLIQRALERRLGKEARLPALEHELEDAAHRAAIGLAG